VSLVDAEAVLDFVRSQTPKRFRQVRRQEPIASVKPKCFRALKGTRAEKHTTGLELQEGPDSRGRVIRCQRADTMQLICDRCNQLVKLLKGPCALNLCSALEQRLGLMLQGNLPNPTLMAHALARRTHGISRDSNRVFE
jgi:hypothetical protein